MSAKIENINEILDFLSGVLDCPPGTPIHDRVYAPGRDELQYHRVLSQIVTDIKITYGDYHRDFKITNPALTSFDEQVSYLKNQIQHVRHEGIDSYKRLFIPLSAVYPNNIKIDGEELENKSFDYVVVKDPETNRYFIDILRGQSAAYYSYVYELTPEEIAAYLQDHNYIEIIASRYR